MCTTPWAAGKRRPKGEFSSLAFILPAPCVFSRVAADREGDGCTQTESSCPQTMGDSGRCLGHFHFDSVTKGLCSLGILGQVLIPFIPLIPKPLETISRYQAIGPRCGLPPHLLFLQAPRFKFMTWRSILHQELWKSY